MDLYALESQSLAKGQKKRANSFSRHLPVCKTSLEMKDDIFVANIMASLNPEPWEMRKKLKSPRPVDHVKRRSRQRIESELSASCVTRSYAKNC